MLVNFESQNQTEVKHTHSGQKQLELRSNLNGVPENVIFISRQWYNHPRRTRWKTNSIFLALFSSFFCFSIPIYVGVGESMSGWMNSCEYGFVAGCLHSKVGPQVHLGVDFIVDIVHYESSN